MSTGAQNVRQLAKARGLRLSKVRSPFIDDTYFVANVVEGGGYGPFTLAEAEEFIRDFPSLERPRKKE